MDYWKNWPKCQYNKELKAVADATIDFLRKHAAKRKNENRKQDVVIFDIDDTILFRDPSGDCELDSTYVYGKESVDWYPPNTSVCRIATEARRLGQKVIILTSRLEDSKEITENNLGILGIVFDTVVYNPCVSDPEGDYGQFKATFRRNMEAKYNIVATVGDQLTDVYCTSYKTAIIKLPEKASRCCYVYFPPV